MTRSQILPFVVVLTGLCLAAQTPFDQTFAPDVPAPQRFGTNRTSYSAVMEVLRSTRPRVTQAQLDQLKTIPLESIFGALGDYRTNYARGFINTRPGERVVGRALTMRFLPPRPDLVRAADTLAKDGNWDRRYYARVAEEAQPGDVVVAELGGADGHNFFGAMAATGIKVRGVAGAVIDGGSRDLAELQADAFKGFPVLARFFHVTTTSWLGVEFNAPVRIGTVSVLPGDVVVGEDEGVLFFPPEMLDTVLKTASEAERREAFQRELLLQKKYRFRDIYPLSPALNEEYEKTRKAR
jgi:4-hydroxy-4-methyl-2-oxoglutarate aldolase